jgi:hypothetical protein
VPFIVETGGRINAAGLQVLSRILPLEAEGTAGLARRHGRAALRGISRALALQQGCMLAQIAEEIHAPDRAAQGTGEGATSIIRTWVLKSMMMTRLIAKVPFPARAQVCVFLRCL